MDDTLATALSAVDATARRRPEVGTGSLLTIKTERTRSRFFAVRERGVPDIMVEQRAIRVTVEGKAQGLNQRSGDSCDPTLSELGDYAELSKSLSRMSLHLQDCLQQTIAAFSTDLQAVRVGNPDFNLQGCFRHALNVVSSATISLSSEVSNPPFTFAHAESLVSRCLVSSAFLQTLIDYTRWSWFSADTILAPHTRPLQPRARPRVRGRASPHPLRYGGLVHGSKNTWAGNDLY